MRKDFRRSFDWAQHWTFFPLVASFNLFSFITPMTPEEAEVLGAHVGDGTLYKTNHGMVWELRGDLKERDYYESHLVPLLNSVFGETFPVKFRSGGPNGCLGFQLARKSVIGWFLKQGFVPGKKSRTVRIPEKVMLGSLEIQYAFIRGLFDTDGCLRFDRSGKQKRYPRLEIGSMSPSLANDLSFLLTALAIRHHRWVTPYGCNLVCINGEASLHFWMKHICPGNPKHVNKYLRFNSVSD